MSPSQLTVQQLEHVTKVWQEKVAAKKLAIQSLLSFQQHAPELCSLLFGMPASEGSTQFKIIVAADQFLDAKIQEHRYDLADLELQLKAIQQQRSGIIVPR